MCACTCEGSSQACVRSSVCMCMLMCTCEHFCLYLCVHKSMWGFVSKWEEHVAVPIEVCVGLHVSVLWLNSSVQVSDDLYVSVRVPMCSFSSCAYICTCVYVSVCVPMCVLMSLCVAGAVRCAEPQWGIR